MYAIRDLSYFLGRERVKGRAYVIQPFQAVDAVQKQYLAVATRLGIKSYRYVILFMRLAMKVQKQAAASRGNVKSAIKAGLFSNRWYTLSVWEDRASMLAFLREEPHATAIRNMAKWGRPDSTFVEFTPANPDVTWAEAKHQLEKPTFTYGQSGRT